MKINVSDETKTLVVLQGQAEKIKYRQPLRIGGATFESIANYIKNGRANAKTSLIILDKENRKATFKQNPNDDEADVVEAVLKTSKDVDFLLNGKKFRRDQLETFLRRNKHLFPNKQDFGELLLSIKEFVANVKIKFEQDDNNRGNKKNSYVQQLESGVPFTTVIEVPIFVGEKKVKLTVDIFFEVTEGEVFFWFECQELNELIENKVNEVFEIISNLLIEKSILIIEI